MTEQEMEAGEELQAGDSVVMKEDGKYYKVRTKQEEIREKLAECYYYFNGWDGETKWEDTREREIPYDFADKAMEILHSQGVVIKVDRELPFVSSNYELSEHNVYVKISNEALREQGYVAFEPLIKEVSNG